MDFFCWVNRAKSYFLEMAGRKSAHGGQAGSPPIFSWDSKYAQNPTSFQVTRSCEYCRIPASFLLFQAAIRGKAQGRVRAHPHPTPGGLKPRLPAWEISWVILFRSHGLSCSYHLTGISALSHPIPPRGTGTTGRPNWPRASIT